MITAALVLLPLIAGPAIWALTPTGPTGRRTCLGWSAAVVLTATLGLSLAAAFAGSRAEWAWGAGLVLTLDVPALAAAVAITVPAVALPVTVYAAAHEPDRGLPRLIGSLVGFAGAMELIVLAGDLLTLLIGWELAAAFSWALIGHEWRDATRPARAAHAFNVTRAGGLGLVLAAGAAFAGTGGIAYADLDRLDGTALHVVAAGVVLAAVAKSGQVPFAPWLFSAMAGPTSASALLHSATMVAAGAYLLARLQPVLVAVGWFGPAVLLVGLTTAVLGGVVAVLQHRAKHLLAASTSAQYGLMLVAIGAGFPLVAVVHLVAHAAFKALLFLAAGVAISAVGSEELGRMRLGPHRRSTAGLGAVGILALAAVPPLGAAWSKERIVAAAVHTDLLAGLLTLVAGGLSALYAARFWLLAFGSTRGDGTSGRELGRPPATSELAAMSALAAVTVALGSWWLPPVHDLLRAAGRIPGGGTWELAASLVVIAAAVYATVVADRHGRLGSLGTAGHVRTAADWLGLPALSRRVVADPVRRLAAATARFDDRVVDAGVRGLGGLGHRASRLMAEGDDRVVDAGVRGLVGLASRASRRSADADIHVVDAGVRGIAAVTQIAAERWTRATELGSDGVVRAIAAGFRWSARDLRGIQTGSAHHYLTIVTVGAATAVILAALWR